MMSKLWKKGLGILMAAIMAAGLTACGQGEESGEKPSDSVPIQESQEESPSVEETAHSTDPLEMITDGYYAYSFYAEGNGDFVSYFHFYEEQPVLGSVFYAGYLNNGVLFAGTYTVEKSDFEYTVAKDRDALLNEQKESGTAPYTVSFYDFAGNLLDQCGYDGDVLYNDMEVVTGFGGGEVMYYHDIDGEASKYASSYAAEMGVPYLDFVAADDEIATLTLNHNMTYIDLVSTIVEGTWSMAENAQGGYDYTLTPNDSADEGAVLSVAADGKSGTYTQPGGDAIEMVGAVKEEPDEEADVEPDGPLFSFTGGYCTFDCYADNTFKFGFESYGLEETGTWSFEDYTFTIVKSDGTEIVAQMDNAHALNFEYTAVSSDQLKDTFTCDAEVWGAALMQ